MRTLIEENFESEHLRTLMCVEAAQAMMPDDRDGTGFIFSFLYPLIHKAGLGFCRGGSGSLSKAIARVIEDNGGKVVTESPVKEILVEGGKAIGVKTDDGSKIIAKEAVVTNLNPKITFLEHLGNIELEESFIGQVKRFKADDMVVFTPHLALNEPLSWKAAEKNPNLEGVAVVGVGPNTIKELQRIYNDIRLGIASPQLGGQTVTVTLADPTQAPPGKHTCLLWQFACYDLEGGAQKWDEIKEEYADHLISEWGKLVYNLDSDNILARYVHSPLDCERANVSMMKGGICSGDIGANQSGVFRPFHGYPPYKTPIERLYLCGPSAPNGGGCSGAPGYCSANVIADDLGIKKWWTPKSISPGK